MCVIGGATDVLGGGGISSGEFGGGVTGAADVLHGGLNSCEFGGSTPGAMDVTEGAIHSDEFG